MKMLDHPNIGMFLIKQLIALICRCMASYMQSWGLIYKEACNNCKLAASYARRLIYKETYDKDTYILQ